jgi:A/G-specific adenine glycosylase
MLQQTQVVAAIPYFLRFVARWPTIADLAAAPDEEVFAAWSGLGYYARCRNLLAAARAALREHGGLPGDLAALRALPGFGPYTAGAVASIAFAVPAPAVDGNVARVLSRLFRLDGDPAARATRERLWALAGALVPAERPGDFNQALMELGATACAPRGPSCARCPLARLCEARRAGVERDLPRKRTRPARRALTVACAVVEREGKVLLTRRPAGAGLFAGLLGFPAVEVAGSDARRALAAGLAAEGLPLSVGAELGAALRALTHRDLTLRAFACRLAGNASAGAHLRWVTPTALAGAGLPSAMRALLPFLEAGPPPRPSVPGVPRGGVLPLRRNSTRIRSRSRSG